MRCSGVQYCCIFLLVRNSREICLSMRKIRLRGRVEIACACGKLKNPKIYEKMRAAFFAVLYSLQSL